MNLMLIVTIIIIMIKFNKKVILKINKLVNNNSELNNKYNKKLIFLHKFKSCHAKF